MPFDGSGNYAPPIAPTFPAISGNAISSSYYNATINDLATAMGNTLTRDGQGKPSANIDWNGKNLTGVAVFSTTGAATIGGSLTGTAGSFTDAITITKSAAATLILRSGSLITNNHISLGRTAEDGALAMVGAAASYFTGTVAGDVALRATGGVLHLGSGSATAQLVLSGTGAAVTGTLSATGRVDTHGLLVAGSDIYMQTAADANIYHMTAVADGVKLNSDNHRFGSLAGSVFAVLNSTGLAVTGALSTASTGAPLTINSTNSNDNKIIFQNAGAAVGYAGATATGPILSDSAAAIRLQISTTGAAITGTLTATGAISGGSSSFTGVIVNSATPILQFYNAAITTRFGYVNHNGTNLLIYNEVAASNITFNVAGGNVLNLNSTGAQVTGLLNASTGVNLPQNQAFRGTTSGGSIWDLAMVGASNHVFYGNTSIAEHRSVSGTNMTLEIGATPIVTINSTSVVAASSLKSTSPTGGVGYGTGAGGVVTQITSKSTAVTLTKICGQITTHNASLAAGATVGFTVNNNTIAATDVVVLSIASGASSALAYTLTAVSIAANLFGIEIRNNSTGALAEVLIINFAVIKAVTA